MSRLCDYLHMGLWFKDKRMWAQPAPMILSLLAHTAFLAGAGIAARCVVLVCSCCFFIMLQLGMMNVSPVN